MTNTTKNQHPEQAARDAIDRQLTAAGWIVQDLKVIDFDAGRGIAVREYPTDVGPADYVLFVDRQALGDIEAKRILFLVDTRNLGEQRVKLKPWDRRVALARSESPMNAVSIISKVRAMYWPIPPSARRIR